MLRITAIPYTLQFRRPALTSRGALHSRRVIFLRAERDGLVGWGECGPVPGLSADDRPDFPARVQQVCDEINAGAPRAAVDLSALPSVTFGLETALRDLRSGGNQRLYDTPFNRGEAILPIHGLIWSDSPSGMLAQVESKVARGCQVIKLKVGALPFGEELALLRELRGRWPVGTMELRLDANGAWQPDEALDHLQQMAALDVSFLEQPIQPGQPDVLAALCTASPVPIALDEELIGASDPAHLLETIRPQHIVLKPSLLGGLAACQSWIVEAERLGVQWWINSLLESNIGLNAVAQWTSALADDRVHGLGTGQLFSNNVPSPLRLDGCGLRLDENGVWEFGGVRERADLTPVKTNPHPNPLPKGEGTKPFHPLPKGEGTKPFPPLPLGEGRGEGALPAPTLTIDDHAFSPDDLIRLDLEQLPAHLSSNACVALLFCRDWLSGKVEFIVQTSGSTGPPKPITLRREQMQASAQATREALGLQASMKALVCLPVRTIAGQMMLVRGLELGLAMTLVEPASDPLAGLPDDTPFDFTAVVPLQLQALLDGPPGYGDRLNRMQAILVGGAPVSVALEQQAQALTAPVYHTYGMTETATHVALRRLNGPDASPDFHPLPGVEIEVDNRGCLRVKGPMTLGQWLQTNDIAEIDTLHVSRFTPRAPRFRWLGRWDNVINSGGVKVQVETVEAKVEKVWLATEQAERRFFVAGLPDARLGQAVTLVIEGPPLPPPVEARLLAEIDRGLETYHAPRRILYSARFVETSSGKIDRTRSLADATARDE